MSDLETRLRGDLAELASSVVIDEEAAWQRVLEAAGSEVPRLASLSTRRPRRRRPIRVWIGAAAVAAIGTAVIAAVALQRSGSDESPTPASPGPTASTAPPVSSTVPPTVGDRIAVVPVEDSPRASSGVQPAWFNRIAATRTEALFRRPDGSAWVRVERDLTGLSWRQRSQQVPSAVSTITVGGLPGLVFQEWSAWVVMVQTGSGVLVARTGGLHVDALQGFMAELVAQPEIANGPNGFEWTDLRFDWSQFTTTDQFLTGTSVRSAELPMGLDAGWAAIDLAPSAATIESIDVGGQVGRLVRSEAGLTLVWTLPEGVVVALGQNDATVDDLLALAPSVRLEALSTQTGRLSINAPLPGDGSMTPADLREVATGEDSHHGRWIAFLAQARSFDPTGAGMQCLYIAAQIPAQSGPCTPSDEPLTAMAWADRGVAVGVAAGNVTEVWIEIDGQRADLQLERIDDDLQRFIGAVPEVGMRNSLHVLLADGQEVAGQLSIGGTMTCAPDPCVVTTVSIPVPD